MFESYNRFARINTQELQGKTLEEVVTIFQECSDSDKKLRNKCFAYVFCDLFPMFLKLFNKYPIPEPIEKVEECIYYVARSMSRYNLKDKAKAKFTSYVYGNIARAYITLTSNCVDNSKKKIWNNLVNWDETKLKWYLNSIPTEDTKFADYEVNSSIENNDALLEEEKELCKCLILGYNKSEELIPRLGITSKKVKDNKTKQYSTVPLTINQSKTKLSKIKKNLREKIKKDHSILF